MTSLETPSAADTPVRPPLWDSGCQTGIGETISLGVLPVQHRATRLVQRAFDVLASLFFLLLLLPLFLLLAALVKASSPGPVLFIQKRVGKDGKEFPLFKFRSMVQDAERLRRALEAQNERSGPVFKMKNDPRITPVGNVLRRFSLDELPQLFNVLKGEMSMIGPRPALPSEVANYTPRQMQRLSVTPGLTGLWQVSGRAAVSFEHSVELDLHYIQNQSVGLNLRIILMTIPAVLGGDGAY